MKSIKAVLSIIMVTCLVQARAQRVGIGEWDSYFTLSTMYDVVEADQKIIWISELSAMYYDMQDKTVSQLNKIHGLSETGFNRVAYNPATKTTVMGYSDGNIDLLSFDGNNKPQVVNMSDIKRSSLTGDKKIYHLYSYNQFVYVSCGFGIVVIDVARQEVKDTYIIGPASSQVKVNGVCIGADTIYATTDLGIYKAYQHNPFLSYHTSWSKLNGMPAWLSSMAFKNPVFANNKLFVIPDYPDYGEDTAYYRNAGVWAKVPVLNGLDMMDIHPMADGNIAYVSRENVSVCNDAFGIVRNLFTYANARALFVNNAVYGSDGYFYTADVNGGPFRCFDSFGFEALLPGGTKTSSVRRLASDGKSLWVAPGQVGGAIFSSNYNTDFFSIKEGNDWSYVNATTDPILAGKPIYDVLDVAIDPTDNTHVVAAAWSFWGLIDIKDKKVTEIYDENNSSGVLFSPAGYPGFCGVSALNFDEDGNLWCVNGQSNKPLVVKTKDGQWKSFYCGSDAAERTYFDVVIDDNKYKYIAIPTRGAQAGGLLVYNDNNTITDETDDVYYFYKTISGLGNMPDADVKCVAIDLDGEVWIGTSKGPAVIYNPSSIFNNGNADAQRVLIEQDGNTQILLETEIISTIKIDAANRKWIGTDNSGVYLLSEDGQDQIFHFTKENSPLPSNTITDIEIDGKSGEVFFATTNGLLSYRGTATESNAKFDNIKVFPNPVRPDYKGLIAVNGLSRDSDVKVTDIAGNIVKVVKSEGGQALWDGFNLKGERVKPGIYLFLCSSVDGGEKVAAKVMFID